MKIKESALGLLKRAPQRFKRRIRAPITKTIDILSDISEAISEEADHQKVKKGSAFNARQDEEKLYDRDVLFQRFEKVKEEELHLYTAYYLGTYSWSEEEEIEIVKVYGKQKSIPSVQPERFTQGNRISDIHPYLLEWLHSYQVTTYPRLGLFDNYHPAFKRWGAEEAEKIYQERQSFNCTES